jgi:leader peptidase (prepilin peptidase) / N-methyltransferase
VRDAWSRFLVALPFGLVLGSFMTVAVARLPERGSLVRPRSRCPSCGAPIRPRDNVPVVSWLILKGRCRHCSKPISPMYPALEVVTGVLVAAGAARFDDLGSAIVVPAMLSLLPAIALIDLRHRIIPNALMYPSLIAFLVAIVVAWLVGSELDPLDGSIGLLAYGGGLFLVALVSRGMGMGDVKLAALLGLVLGSIGLRFVAVAASGGVLVGGLAGVGALIAGRGRKSAIPFGPSMVVGAIVAVFAGERIASWYLDSLG